MTTQSTPRSSATINLNHLRRGASYLATTRHGTAVGEYLGMERLFGDRALLLRNSTGTASIYRDEIISIELLAA